MCSLRFNSDLESVTASFRVVRDGGREADPENLVAVRSDKAGLLRLALTAWGRCLKIGQHPGGTPHRARTESRSTDTSGGDSPPPLAARRPTGTKTDKLVVLAKRYFYYLIVCFTFLVFQLASATIVAFSIITGKLT